MANCRVGEVHLGTNNLTGLVWRAPFAAQSLLSVSVVTLVVSSYGTKDYGEGGN